MTTLHRDEAINAFGVATRTAAVLNDVRNPLTELDRRVWEFVRDEGGYFAWPEVAGALGVAVPNGPSPLCRLYRRCHMSRRGIRVNGRVVYVYGVTAACTPPEGQSLEPEPKRARELPCA